MIFKDPKFKTKYDIDSVNENYTAYSYKDLAKTISKVVLEIENDLNNGINIQLNHVDNNGDDIYILAESVKSNKKHDDVYNRSIIEIENILKRPNKTSIHNYLKSWKIEEPNEDSKNRIKYFKLLYLFYMVQYILFPEEKNVLSLISKEKISSDIAPIKNAKKGKYLAFILFAVCEDMDANKRFLYKDELIEIRLNNISNLLNKYVSEMNPSYSEDISTLRTPRLISIARKRMAEIKKQCLQITVCPLNNIYRIVTSYIFDYISISYSNELIKNILPLLNNSLNFGDIEENLSYELQNQTIYIDNNFNDCIDFINIPEVKHFCMKGSRNKYPKQFDFFLENIFDNDIERFLKFGEAFWIEKDKIGLYVKGDVLAVLTRTFCDLGSSKKIILDVKLPSKNWEHEISYRKALTEKSIQNVVIYFYLAFEAEMYTFKRGYGSYPLLFRPLVLEKHLLIQEIIKNAFEIENFNARLLFLSKMASEIQSINQEL